jgi:hypothetical protein
LSIAAPVLITRASGANTLHRLVYKTAISGSANDIVFDSSESQRAITCKGPTAAS